MRFTRTTLAVAFLLCGVLAPSAALADHAQEPTDLSKMDYTPIGKYGAAVDGDGTPQALAPGQTGSTTIPPTPNPASIPATGGEYPASIFNPSGKYVAYDTDLFMSIHYPDRHPDSPDEETEQDPAKDIGPGGAIQYGTCPPRPGFISGDCGNHQREYGEFFKATMQEILGDFGVEMKRYPFYSPGAGLPRGGPLGASDGAAVNVAAVVPGTDHPEDTIIVSGHYDFTDSGPAAAWDSSEGHTQVMRMAAIMADYWRKTNTRPSATVKFMPFDSEESGTFGSIDYVANNIPPGEEDKVRGYFNVDPCAGGYPAFKNGNPAQRIPEVLQLANPEAPGLSPEVKARFEKFNARGLGILEEVFDNLDDTLTVAGTKRDIFVSRQEGKDAKVTSDLDRDFKIAVGGLALFSSDYANFEAVGIPIFNLFPDVFGPKADPASDGNRPPSSEGLSILHTPNDNFTAINRLTNADPSGLMASEGWAKGMEMCAQIESAYMLQPEMGGAQKVAPDVNPPVAYFEALPNEAIQGEAVNFTADGSYQYANADTRQYVPDSELTYTWDFGDGTPVVTGKRPEHRYAKVGRYDAKLTVSRGGLSDTMVVPITVIAAKFSPPKLDPIAADDAKDGTFGLKFAFDGETEGLEGFAVEESRNFREVFTDGAEEDLAVKWDAPAPTGARLEPWQRSDSSTRKQRGNIVKSGKASYWAGVSQTNLPRGSVDSEAVLQTKAPVTLPTEDPELSYQSDFCNEGDDRGFVEVALVADNAPPGFQPDFAIVDGGTPGEGPGGRDPQDICNPTEPESIAPGAARFEERRIDLSQYRGKKVLIRFRLAMGDADRAASQPTGWYLDDISVRAGTFSEIGTTPAKAFEVKDRPNGGYAYRVRGRYAGGVTTGVSNVQQATVTSSGVKPDGPKPPDTTPPGGGGGGGGGGGDGTKPPVGDGCVAAPAFRSTSAKRSGRGLRFNFKRRTSNRATVEVFQVSKGKRTQRFRRVARFTNKASSFSWKGRGKGGKRLRDGYYVVRYSARADNGTLESRRVPVRRSRGRFALRPAYESLDGCGTLRRFRLSSPVFGGSRRSTLGIGFRISQPARVSVQILRGSRTVKRFGATSRAAGTGKLRLSSRGLRRGDYRVRMVVERGGERITRTLTARRL